MVRECELCLTSNLSLSDFDEEKKTISFLNWQRVDKNITKINPSLPFDQAVEKWNSTILTIKNISIESESEWHPTTSRVGF